MTTNLDEATGLVEKPLGQPRSYERPSLTPVGNLNDLLAAGGTQNADPGPSCTPGGVFFDGPDCT